MLIRNSTSINHNTGDQFSAVLAQSGLTEKSFKSQLKYNLLVQKATEANTDTSDKTLKNTMKHGNQILL